MSFYRNAVERVGVWPLIVCMLSTAAYSASASGPPSGFIRMKYVQVSGSSVVFRIENLSTQSIYFRGANNSSGNAVPLLGIARMECRKLGAGTYNWDEYIIGEGGPETVEIAPGKQRLVEVDATFALQHKGGGCRVQLRLEGGTFIQSNFFEPQ
jgi:hypothetical protein